jgi:hypothetical protein
MQKNYYAIIPANVRYDKELPANAKLLYGEITALCNERGYCWATNAYFSELYEVHNKSISRLISRLEKKGYIRIEMLIKDKQVKSRHIYITSSNADVTTSPQNCVEGSNEIVTRGSNEIVTDNNTSFNTTKEYIQFADTVRLTQEQYDRLVEEYGKKTADDYIERLDEWQTNNPKKKKKDHNKTLRVWMKDVKKVDKPKQVSGGAIAGFWGADEY